MDGKHLAIRFRGGMKDIRRLNNSICMTFTAKHLQNPRVAACCYMRPVFDLVATAEENSQSYFPNPTYRTSPSLSIPGCAIHTGCLQCGHSQAPGWALGKGSTAT